MGCDERKFSKADIMKNTIYIIGAGAIGKVLAVLLKNAGRDVILLRGSVDDLASHIETVIVELREGTIKEKVEVSTISNFSRLDGLVILTNKSFGNERLAEMLESKIHQSPVVLLQNGLNNELPFLNRNFPQLYRGVLFTSSQATKEGTFRFKPATESRVGVIKGSMAILENIILQLNNSYFQFRAEENIQRLIWKKAINNCVFNSICPLLETDNGIFYRNEKALHLAEEIIDECLEVAVASGIILAKKDILETLFMISRSSEGQLISTYQDILRKRKTEIDSLNLAVSEMAGELQMGNRIEKTKLLGELIRLKSELRN
jgi:2-dehydropantoate 2-reductase